MNSSRLHSQSGAFMFLWGLIFMVILALAAFAVDIGYIAVNKNKLQNAADAAAQAGASTIFRATGFSFNDFPTGIYPSTPDVATPGYTNSTGSLTYITMAELEAKKALALNGITDAEATIQVKTNWWNDPEINSLARFRNPAVKVILTTTLPLFFSKYIGVGSTTFSVYAVSISPFPSGIRGTVPLAVSNCAYVYGWDIDSQKPREFNSASTLTPGSYYTIKSGTAAELASLVSTWGLVKSGGAALYDYNTNTKITASTPLVIGSTFQLPTCANCTKIPAGNGAILNSGFVASTAGVLSGNTNTGCTATTSKLFTALWSNMTNDASYGTSASVVSYRVIGQTRYNPTEVNVGSQIYLASGNQGTNYGNVEACRTAGTCYRVTLPVLDDITDTDATANALKTVRGFTCIYLLKSDQSSSTVIGKFASGCNNAAISKPTEKYLGSMTSPRLAE